MEKEIIYPLFDEKWKDYLASIEDIKPKNRTTTLITDERGALDIELAFRVKIHESCNQSPITEDEINEIKNRLSKELKPGMYQISSNPLESIKYLG